MTKSSREILDPKFVCSTLGKNRNLLVTPDPPARLDCMGQKLNLTHFCRHHFSGRKNLLRGFYDSKRVVCQFGQAVFLSLKCDGKYKNQCLSPKKSCRKFNQIVAHDLILVKASLLEREKLNCHFMAENKPMGETQELLKPLL